MLDQLVTGKSIISYFATAYFYFNGTIDFFTVNSQLKGFNMGLNYEKKDTKPFPCPHILRK